MLRSYHQKEIAFEAGCDEAGRGCLAGPVFAAAVILPVKFRHKLLNDSKQLKVADREYLRGVIEEKALFYAVASVDNEEIDKINILQASFRAMHLALEKLQQQPGYILVDGNRFKPYGNVPHACIIKGDGIYASIAAASILAKTYRDEYMMKLHEQFPHFGWLENKGYPTIQHRNAIRVHGDTPFHRKSFRLLPDEQLSLDFGG
ncbi:MULTISPECIES: ribonuclease HII [unclassified Chitinophaga]|uniref:ribonuclease HII n=1 Tax=unclassified Chitinophaga TaxID=2619133 RepID=UPI0009C9E7F4|nr:MULTISPECIES: ribonuclease HII [unclassified Chitinophaga]OMP77490.1 ribonuclease HII [[Flexibacter] sp. ATCC 35208]WPV68776.1 ribonuclease HII [Chitinophaga sp. LS1]